MKKAILTLITFTISISIYGQSPLLIPDYLTGDEIQLTLQKGQVELYQGFSTNTIGYNQNVLGPTLILDKGQEISFDVVNLLTEPTTLHWHGLHVSSKNDGGPHTVINPNQTWSPSFTVLDEAATYWYHPHLHEKTEEQVTMGGAGLIIVRDSIESELDLPRNYGVDDIPIIIQSRAFDDDKQFLTKTAEDNTIMCNATIDAFLNAPAQLMRLRILNGSTERIYNLGFSNDQTFFQIATDGGLLASPVSMNRLMLAPGERTEILLDLTSKMGETLKMMSYNSELPSGYYGASNPSVMPMGSIEGYSSNSLNGNDFKVLDINVIAPTSDAIFLIPTTLVNHIPYSENDVDMTRSLTFRPNQMGPNGMLNGPFSINGQSYQLDIINQEVLLGDIEVWELRNMTAIAHPFHIHDVQFYILDINGIAPPLHLQGRKDVVLVPPMGGIVRFIARFDDHADKDTPYMYHCHMFSHEDAGMMGQFLVLPLTTSNIANLNSQIVVSPNPAVNNIKISGAPESSLQIYDLNGHLIRSINHVIEDQVLDISDLSSGHYIIRIKGIETVNNFKLVKM